MKAIFFFLITVSALFGQENYPQDYFRSPLDIPLLTSGTFGELRTNHFHSGIDFRTQKIEGLPVYAAADGYVSRIKISTYGYGKAIYITHPNGFTTVYGHLLKATPTIEDYIKKKHYKEKSFEIDVFPIIEELKVKKGDVIAFSGNTGGSFGPHLHYEFRDSKTEKVINPFYFGLSKELIDTRPPIIEGLLVYPMDENAIVNVSKQPILANLVLQKDGSYMASSIKANGTIAFGLQTHDLSNNNYGKNGVFGIQTYLNGNLNFTINFDTFSFDETRHVNNYIDYERYVKTKQKFQKLFIETPYGLSLLSKNQSNGLINIQPNNNYVYRIEVTDFHQNKTIIHVPIQFSNAKPTILPEVKKSSYFVKYKKEHQYIKDSVTVFIPEDTFYKDTSIDFDVSNDTIKIGSSTLAIKRNITLSINNSSIVEEERSRYFIASFEGSKLSYNRTYLKGNYFTIYTRNLGDFVLAKDSIAPKIEPLNFTEGKWMSTLSNIEVTVSDDFSGIQSYNGFLNNQWILFEYDFKTNKLTHDFADNIVIEGRNELKIIVVDNVGNSTIFETHFFRSQKP
jgi:murein DD-endopeptidase MepM/ murein hydrolase activator NlpD